MVDKESNYIPQYLSSNYLDRSWTWEFYENNFSKRRMASYLVESLGDVERAKNLYQWNVNVSAGFMEIICYLEVVLRNKINEKLKLKYGNTSQPNTWIENLGEMPNISLSYKKEIKRILQRLQKKGLNSREDQIISELPFGFWLMLVSKKQNAIWPDLAQAFPNSPTRNRKAVHDLMLDIKTLRNRIAHHHKISNLNLNSNLDKIYTLAQYLDSDFSVWLREKSRVDELLRKKL
jgi:hypothetical protein